MRPIPDEEFSRLIGSIYDCALDPSRWPATLGVLNDLMRFRVSTLSMHDVPTGQLLLAVNHGYSEVELAGMYAVVNHVADSWGGRERILSLPIDEPLIQTAVNPARAQCLYVREWADPFGYADALAVFLTRDAASVGTLAFGRHRDDGPIGEAEVALARLFVPHLKRALVISRLLEARAVERATFAAALDVLSVAVLLVTGDLRLIHANRAGETLLRARDPLGLCAGRVTAANGVDAALRAALAAPLGGIGRRGLGIPARRVDGEELVLHVLPLGDGGPLPGATAAIFVAPATQPRPAPIAAIAALFDLTPAETRVLELIGAGRGNAEIAAALGVAASTVRTHLLRLFEKTGTHRQADLVGLLASFSLPLG
ncbi:helix-turn-helix transcriptional regulator [uncultured Amaricoccus sp.]|uniref:helix-turn-helix transcriptional regulator n=2 Tax=Amaricoccus TaxID=56999 RepID=UPI00261DB992|nr:helix-turn-helix transcriptional regulator [uncultured Amaricoccus sp.]